MSPLMEVPLIELKEVSKIYSLESGLDLKVLQNLQIKIKEHEFVALLGPSGSGKSTCLRLMAGLVPASQGQILSRGQILQGYNQDVALVFQSFALFPWETVFSNVALALDGQHLPLAEIKTRVKKVIDLVGLEGFEEAYPRELSGGMKQRVGIARALVLERPLLFLDEPFSALDVLTADTLRHELVKIFREKKTATQSVLLVTHNIQEAVFMAQRILVMGTSPGHIRQEIINDVPYPRDPDSKHFQKMVAQIHALITETLMPDETKTEPAPETSVPSAKNLADSSGKNYPLENRVEALPKVQITEVIGLLEALQANNGRADIFELAQEIGRDFGHTLYLVKAAELLDLVDTPKQMVFLNELGKTLAQGDINLRKQILHDAFGKLRIVQICSDLIRTSSRAHISLDELTHQVSKWLPNENPHQVLETLISWGRFAEYFGYSSVRKELYLDLGQETV